jgi:hypothetical protein
MKLLLGNRRLAATLMLGVIAASVLAPAAEAGHYRRYKPGPPQGYVVRRVATVYPTHRVTYVRSHSDAAPLFAGLVGGLILGAALSSRAQPVVQTSYSYWDPYCDESFASLEIYRSHVRHYHHPRVVRVIEIGSGRCVRDMCWRDDQWRDYDGPADWNDGYWQDRQGDGDDD